MPDEHEGKERGPGEAAEGTPLEPALNDAFGFGDDHWWELAGRAVRPAGSLGALGGYELIEELGRGGQGSVYKAVQPGTGRVVAIKRLGSAVLLGDRQQDRFRERYRAEIDALTRLQHPCVVTVHAAEVLDGHPVLVMEFVDGEPIDRWADRQWAGGQWTGGREPVRALLECFLKVCEGVSHAHQRGVIHRDIKPSNIMVQRAGAEERPEGRAGAPPSPAPQVKVLDFGIARLLSGWRAAGLSTFTGFAGTPAYASPEQLAGGRHEPDTRSDVYSLGVLLGRLLGGREPCEPEASIAQVLSAIQHGGVRRPSRDRPGLARELDLIVLKATRSEPRDRYQSVDALADDVQRFLDGRAIAAHPPGRAYLLAKFVRRHRGACAAGSLAGAAIIGLAVVSSVQAVRLNARGIELTGALGAERSASARANQARVAADEARRTAEAQERVALEERDRQRQTSDFLLGVVEKIAAHSDGRSTIPIQSLAQWIEDPLEEANTAVDTEVLARLHLGVGTLHGVAARSDAAAGHERRAIELLTRPDQAELRLRAMLKAASRQTYRGRPSPAETAATEALAAVEEAGFLRTGLGVEALRQFSVVLSRSGRRDEAIEALQRALAIVDETDQPAEVRSMVLSEIAQRHLGARRHEQAAEFARAALECIPLEQRDSSEAGWRATMTLGTVRFREGDVVEAERQFALATDGQLRALGDGHIRTRNAMRWHARALHELGRYDDAARIQERLLQLIPPEYEPADIGTWQTRFRYGATLLGQGRTQEAARQLGLAISRGGSQVPQNPAQALERVTGALEATGLHFTPELRERLGDLAWLVGETSDQHGPEAGADAPEGPRS